MQVKMVKLSQVALAVLVLAVSAIAQPTPQAAVQASPKSEPASRAAKHAEDEKSLRTQAEEYASAFERGDAASISNMWTKEGSLTDTKGRLFKGRDAIARLYQAYFTQFGGQPMEIAIASLKFPSDNIAIEEGTARLRQTATPGSSSRYLVVHVKDSGQWLMSAVVETACALPSSHECLKDLSWLIGDWTAKGVPGKALHLKANWAGSGNFIHCLYQEDGSARASATQIIGWNPVSQKFVSWYFDQDGGFGQGTWVKDTPGWRVDARAIEPDGTTCSATYVFKPLPGDSFSWRSIKRKLGGSQLPNTPEIIIERDQPHK